MEAHVASEFDISNVTKLPRVDIVFADADMEPDLIDASVNAGAKGIVIAGVGNGNMNKVSVDAAARAVKKGVIVVRSSRVATGHGRPQRGSRMMMSSDSSLPMS